MKLWDSFNSMVKALVKPGVEIANTLMPTDADLWHGATGVATEAGELLDAVKKLVIYRRDLDIANVIEELGDLEFYMEQVRQNLSISRSETLDSCMRKHERRYASGTYSDNQAQARADKEPRG